MGKESLQETHLGGECLIVVVPLVLSMLRLTQFILKITRPLEDGGQVMWQEKVRVRRDEFRSSRNKEGNKFDPLSYIIFCKWPRVRTAMFALTGVSVKKRSNAVSK